MDDRDEYIREQIMIGAYNLPEEILIPAIRWIAEYAKTHETWNGGDLLPIYKTSEGYVPIQPHKHNWSGAWGSVMTIASSMGIMTWAGESKPKSLGSHTKELADWNSELYIPEFLR